MGGIRTVGKSEPRAAGFHGRRLCWRRPKEALAARLATAESRAVKGAVPGCRPSAGP
jgi:hypothetical protein